MEGAILMEEFRHTILLKSDPGTVEDLMKTSINRVMPTGRNDHAISLRRQAKILRPTPPFSLFLFSSFPLALFLSLNEIARTIHRACMSVARLQRNIGTRFSPI